MTTRRMKNIKGFTITELIIAEVLSVCVILGIGICLVDCHRGWSAMFNRIYSDVVTDSHAARRVFDRIIRKASSQNITLAEDGSWIEAAYYQDSDSEQPDRYARFYVSENQLMVSYGTLNPKAETTNLKICDNVTSCVFSTTGTSVQMVLKLDNESEEATVVSSAVAHN
jgi:hypothetical protein